MPTAEECLLELSTAPNGSTAEIHFTSIKDRFSVPGGGLESELYCENESEVVESLVSNLSAESASNLVESKTSNIFEISESETCP